MRNWGGKVKTIPMPEAQFRDEKACKRGEAVALMLDYINLEKREREG